MPVQAFTVGLIILSFFTDVLEAELLPKPDAARDIPLLVLHNLNPVTMNSTTCHYHIVEARRCPSCSTAGTP